METLYATNYAFPRDKHVQYRPVSALSSPSAKSSSSFDSQEDLLPELWLESPPLENYAFTRPLTTQSIGSSPIAVHQSPFINSNFAADSYYSGHEQPKSFHSSVLLRDESLEYAQSLLPNSLLFPLTGHGNSPRTPHENATKQPTAVVRKELTELNVAKIEDDTVQVRPQSRRSSSSSKCRHGSTSSSSSCSKAQAKNLNTQLYKTELCASFMKSGACPYGGKCQFAHGEAELKSVARPSNWRSKPCANWARSGSCRYGNRCCFKHGD
ncbi:hypothetical protein OXX80_005923 [Metschnikowia pulcherrima]